MRSPTGKEQVFQEPGQPRQWRIIAVAVERGGNIGARGALFRHQAPDPFAALGIRLVRPRTILQDEYLAARRQRLQLAAPGRRRRAVAGDAAFDVDPVAFAQPCDRGLHFACRLHGHAETRGEFVEGILLPNIAAADQFLDEGVDGFQRRVSVPIRCWFQLSFVGERRMFLAGYRRCGHHHVHAGVPVRLVGQIDLVAQQPCDLQVIFQRAGDHHQPSSRPVVVDVRTLHRRVALLQACFEDSLLSVFAPDFQARMVFADGEGVDPGLVRTYVKRPAGVCQRRCLRPAIEQQEVSRLRRDYRFQALGPEHLGKQRPGKISEVERLVAAKVMQRTERLTAHAVPERQGKEQP